MSDLLVCKLVGQHRNRCTMRLANCTIGEDNNLLYWVPGVVVFFVSGKPEIKSVWPNSHVVKITT